MTSAAAGIGTVGRAHHAIFCSTLSCDNVSRHVARRRYPPAQRERLSRVNAAHVRRIPMSASMNVSACPTVALWPSFAANGAAWLSPASARRPRLSRMPTIPCVRADDDHLAGEFPRSCSILCCSPLTIAALAACPSALAGLRTPTARTRHHRSSRRIGVHGDDRGSVTMTARASSVSSLHAVPARCDCHAGRASEVDVPRSLWECLRLVV